MIEFNVLKRFLTTEDGQEFYRVLKKVMRGRLEERICYVDALPPEQKTAYLLGRGEPVRFLDYIVDEYEPGENND